MSNKNNDSYDNGDGNGYDNDNEEVFIFENKMDYLLLMLGAPFWPHINGKK